MPAHWTATSVAEAIEAQAQGTSWKQLEAFGEQSLKLAMDRRLRRLDFIANELSSGTDRSLADKWNGILAAQARAAGSHRYLMMARLNNLYGDYLRGDNTAVAQFTAIGDRDPDWFVRVNAKNSEAFNLIRSDLTVAALRKIEEGEALVLQGDPAAHAAEARLSETKGVALLHLQDLDEGAEAFARVHFELTRSNYPNPDFSDIYSLGLAAARLGYWPLAEDLAARHHRLTLHAMAQGSDLPVIWDKYLCAVVAEHASPQRVLSCLEGLDLTSPASKARPLAPR
ncbi:MAG: hypothetical protein WA840_04070, partial [Caulobacteraceae bacterium]